MDKIYKRVVLSELRKFKAADEEYRQDREDWYRTGDGRSPDWYQGPDDERLYNYGGKGYGYPYCPHGSSLWTDYDNICGGCEDGSTVYQLAIWSAQEKVAEYNRRVDWLLDAPKSLGWDVKRDLLDWAVKPIEDSKL
jgi:hypothetical protein